MAFPNRELWHKVRDHDDGKFSNWNTIVNETLFLQERISKGGHRIGATASQDPHGLLPACVKATLFQRCARHLSGNVGYMRDFKNFLSLPYHLLQLQARCFVPVMAQIVLALPGSDDDFHYLLQWWQVSVRNFLNGKGRAGFFKEWKDHLQYLDDVLFHDFDGRNSALPKYSPRPPEDFLTLLRTGSEDAFVALGNISTARSLPSGDEARMEQEELDTLDVLTMSPIPMTEEERTEITRCSKICGYEIKRCADKVGAWKFLAAHSSISNTSCFERTGAENGKFGFFFEEFFQKWLTEIDDEIITTPIGVTVTFRGEPRWRATIDGVPDVGPEEFLAPRTEEAWNPKLNGADSARQGMLLWVFSYLWLKDSGFLTEEGDPTGKPFHAVLTLQGEPGNKVRGPTKSEACLITYLQPYAHMMNTILKADPTMSAGLSGGHMVYEFWKDFKNHDFSGHKVMLGDYTAATNWIQFERANLHMDSMMGEFPNASDYVRKAHRLILQPVCFSTPSGFEVLTTRGALMGLPGTKIILHTLSKAIEIASTLERRPKSPDELKLHPYRIAGDDTMKFALSIPELEKFSEKTVLYSLEPSREKWRHYEKGGKFCQELFRMEGGKFHFVDFVPGRALSRETKAAQDQDTNPLFGKASYLAKRIEWNKTVSHDQVGLLMQLGFRVYGDYSSIYRLPQHLGGFGFTRMTSDNTPDLVKAVAWYAYQQRKEGFNPALSALRGISSPLLFDRGCPIKEPKAAPYSGCLTFIDHAELVAFHSITETRFFFQQKEILQRGYRLESSLKSGLLPFWERKDTQKGWKTAPLSMRLTRLAQKTAELILTPPTVEQWELVLNTKPYDFIVPARYYDPEARYPPRWGIPVNIDNAARGLSLAWKLPTRVFFQRKVVEV